MGDAAGIGVLGLDSQADHEAAIGILAVEKWPVVVEEWAGAKQRLEAPWRVAFHQGPPQAPRSPATARRGAALTATSLPNHALNPMRPWCSSMPIPSTQMLPRARARESRSVSSGM